MFAWLIQNWQVLTDKLARSFMDLGLRAGGFEGAGYYTGEPGNIAYLGYTTAQPLIDQIGRLCGPVAFFKNFQEIFFLAIAVVAVIAAFCVITIQVVIALLSFKFGTLAAFVLVPFAVLSKTAFIAERPLGWVVSAGVRLMVLTLVLGVGNNLFQRLRLPPGSTVTTFEAFAIMLAALILMVLSLVASRLATDLVIGGPSLGGGTTAATVGAGVGAAAYSARTVHRGTRAGLSAVKWAAAIPSGGTSVAAATGARVAGTAAQAGVTTASAIGSGGSAVAGAGPRMAVAGGAAGSASAVAKPKTSVPKTGGPSTEATEGGTTGPAPKNDS
jgi:type IV secretion system protein TrbL